MLKPGDKVLVYERPFTKHDLEGTAVLVERLGQSTLSEVLENWYVRFEGDERNVVRRVDLADIVK